MRQFELNGWNRSAGRGAARLLVALVLLGPRQPVVVAAAESGLHGDPYYVAGETIRRLKVVGFNMVRDWGIQSDDTATKGDL